MSTDRTAAGLLLTGGSSRRMGRDKATLTHRAGRTWAQTVGGVLAGGTHPSLEVGPGHSGLRAVPDDRPGAGPLAAVATGARALRADGWSGPVMVVATDLPGLTASLLAWLVGHPATGSVVPLDSDGRPQPLCARWSSDDLLVAAALVDGGARALRDLIDRCGPHLVPIGDWAGDPAALTDADTPAEAAPWTAGAAGTAA